MRAAPRDGSGFTAVIGGGGAMAIGISAGILMALKEAGLDVADAAAAIGTSAGSTVAADVQLGVPLDEIAARVCTDRPLDVDDHADDATDIRAPLATTPAWRTGPVHGRRAVGSTGVLTRAMSPVRVPLPEPPGFLRRSFPGGLLSLGESHDWASEFYPEAWPDRRVCAVASDVDSGRRVMLEADPAEGTPRATLRRALQASCAIPGLYPPVRVDGARLVDGGIRSATNLDLAARLPSRAVLAVSAITYDPSDPPSGPGRLLRMWPNRTVLREVGYLRRLGHEVLLLRPGRVALELAGTTLFSGRITSDLVEAAYEGARQRLAMPDMQGHLERFAIAAQASSAA
ncbi:MAG: patatin-like phospholipase family protein [Ilumatobacteraceae bacterium]